MLCCIYNSIQRQDRSEEIDIETVVDSLEFEANGSTVIHGYTDTTASTEDTRRSRIYLLGQRKVRTPDDQYMEYGYCVGPQDRLEKYR